MDQLHWCKAWEQLKSKSAVNYPSQCKTQLDLFVSCGSFRWFLWLQLHPFRQYQNQNAMLGFISQQVTHMVGQHIMSVKSASARRNEIFAGVNGKIVNLDNHATYNKILLAIRVTQFPILFLYMSYTNRFNNDYHEDFSRLCQMSLNIDKAYHFTVS